MGDGDDAVRVEHNAAARRYQAEVAGELAVAEYRREGATIVFTHTAVPEGLRGRGIADRLAQTALEEARTQGLAVVPVCPFFAAYIRRHPEFSALVPEDFRARLARAAAAKRS